MILILDNHDSFTHNVARYCAEMGHEVSVVPSDRITLAGIAALAPEALIVSPGPGRPEDAGVSMAAIGHFTGRLPILGVCLGHQAVGAVFGGGITRAAEPMHGRASRLAHDGTGPFTGLPQGVQVGRYHSLIVAPTPQMETHLRVTARSEAGEVMALAHRSHPTFGLQFHPESVLSEHGHRMIGHVLDLAGGGRDALVG
ncbi:anthranilate synthase component II [Mangrovicoccus algicola]|uniref:Aminodeoxychorismate/anthranilate synthase component II n=1 Tax=Mangrovicoccus algicola TaxID=2771008 RepID=A0A8J6Z9E0_9RHOB|nr:aminodeoxychorismate/anthranilate synthase component II [Mangrovicoccus algicola]MBE3638396.1 aminodeoxychorismate/anthranilate synthase component II [Mangrovicoccus algicola]